MAPLTRNERRMVLVHLVGFFFIGLLMGITEDLLAIYFATDAEITPRVVLIAFLVALPFAFLSEILVDLRLFRKLFRKILRQREETTSG